MTNRFISVLFLLSASMTSFGAGKYFHEHKPPVRCSIFHLLHIKNSFLSTKLIRFVVKRHWLYRVLTLGREIAGDRRYSYQRPLELCRLNLTSVTVVIANGSRKPNLLPIPLKGPHWWIIGILSNVSQEK